MAETSWRPCDVCEFVDPSDSEAEPFLPARGPSHCMLSIFQRTAWLAASLAMLLGCSDDSETGGQSEPGDPELVIGECFGKNTDCNGIPTVERYEPGPSITCEQNQLGIGSIFWSFPQQNVDCPDPPCTLEYSRVSVTADGTLQVIGRLNSPQGSSAGVWLSRFAPDGEQLEVSVHEFEISTRFSEPRFWVPIGHDAAGNAFVVRRSGDLNISTNVDASLLRFDRGESTPKLVTAIDNVVAMGPVIAPDGSFAMEIVSPYDPENPLEEMPQRIDVARYDPNGRLLWNQIKLTRALAISGANVVGFDQAGNLTLHLTRQIVGAPWLPPPRYPDGSYLTVTKEQLVRLDTDGNVLWIYALSDLSSAWPAAVAPDGSVYLIRGSITERDDGFWVNQPPRLERLEPSGRSAWSLELPGLDADAQPSLDIDADGNLLVSSVRSGATLGEPSVQHQLISPDGRRCTIFERPCVSGTICSLESGRAGPNQSVYFAIGRAASP